MTIDEAIKKYKEKSEFFKKTTNVSYALELEQIVKWLEELKLYRLAIKQCKENSYMVNSKEFAKHMEEWVKEQLKEDGTDEKN